MQISEEPSEVNKVKSTLQFRLPGAKHADQASLTTRGNGTSAKQSIPPHQRALRTLDGAGRLAVAPALRPKRISLSQQPWAPSRPRLVPF